MKTANAVIVDDKCECFAVGSEGQRIDIRGVVNQIPGALFHLEVRPFEMTKFSAAVAMDILRTHPQVIIGGILRENPYYVPPDEFLREVRGRDVPAH